ncbi:MAG TPA: hypothetical protein VEC12_14080 [Bacteroidia bacterium]|nr:hypothetical protein [Bacteroidia bacterium]
MSGQPIYNLEKSLWTHADYEQMDWHDCKIHGLSIEYNGGWGSDLLLDIDYIFQWVQAEKPGQPITFFIAPCTLVFKDAYGLHLNINDRENALGPLAIEELYIKDTTEVETNKFAYTWGIDLQNGSIEFNSFGMQQIVRLQPVYSQYQIIDTEARGGVSFSRVPC